MSTRWAGLPALTRLAVVAVTVGALAAGAPAAGASTRGGQDAASGQGTAGPVAGTADGAVRGLANGAVDEFLGIPYAAPPAGATRPRSRRTARSRRRLSARPARRKTAST